MISANAAMTGSYDHSEVARSVFIATAASYAALDLAGRVTAASGRVRLAWLSGGATAMGIGIWAMHLKGMLAFRLPVPIEYHWPAILASLLVAILASAVALYVTSRQKMGPVEALTGSVIMGSGIAGMHYIGMAAMRLPAITRFSSLLVTISILLAILFSLIALLMAFGLRAETRWTVPRRLGSATVMGLAVSAMHYTGMAAASFIPSSPPDLSHAVSISPFGNSGIAIVTLMVLVAASVTSSVDRRASVEVQRVNQDLEHRVAERTSQLEAINRSLRKEIAERERAEEGVRRSEDHLRLVIDTIPQQIWSGPPGGSLDYCNAQWRSYTGLTQEELQGEGWQSMLHPDDRERVLKAWRESVANRTPYEQEERHRGADAQYRWFLARAVPLRDSEGHIVRWYGTNTDMEDRKRTEAALLEAQANLTRVTRVVAMGELAAAIAHEVNQPLAAIVTNGNFCLRQLAGGGQDLEKLREAIAEIVNDGARASAIIRRIRALLMKGAPDRTELDIHQVILEVTGLLRHELTRNRVSLRTDLAPDLPRVLGDRVQLQQVMLNLIMNGTDAVSVLTDRPRELLIKSAKHPDGVLIQVQDSGPGIDPGQADRIFEPFFTTKPEGIGMGLSISRSIIESHGGRLWAVEGSNGALFEFTLPAQH
ncbi:MAG TPA: MHYT domain-containing protein [Terriglobales bacterium]|nr:MHYT domain-containing protein [Terriglobales bacterium]